MQGAQIHTTLSKEEVGTAEGDRRSTEARAEDQVNIQYYRRTVESSYLRTKRSKLRSPGRVLPVLILLQSPFQIHGRGLRSMSEAESLYTTKAE